MKGRTKESHPARVSERTKPAGEIRDRWSWVEPEVWTERMLTALENGVKEGSQTPTLPSMGCSLSFQPIRRPVNPLGGELPTGEPCAGEPHARFGGGRNRELNRFFLPLSYLKTCRYKVRFCLIPSFTRREY